MTCPSWQGNRRCDTIRFIFKNTRDDAMRWILAFEMHGTMRCDGSLKAHGTMRCDGNLQSKTHGTMRCDLIDMDVLESVMSWALCEYQQNLDRMLLIPVVPAENSCISESTGRCDAIFFYTGRCDAISGGKSHGTMRCDGFGISKCTGRCDAMGI